MPLPCAGGGGGGGAPYAPPLNIRNSSLLDSAGLPKLGETVSSGSAPFLEG